MRHNAISQIDTELTAFLCRIGIKLLLIAGMALAIHDTSIVAVIKLLCLAFSFACMMYAIHHQEPFAGPKLNNWDEAIALMGVAFFAHVIL